MITIRPPTGLIFSCLVYKRSYGHQQTTHQSHIFLFSVQTVIWSSVDHSLVLNFLVQFRYGHQKTTDQSYIFLFSVQTVIWSSVDHSPVLYFLVQCTQWHQLTTDQSYIFLFSVQTVIWSSVDFSPAFFFHFSRYYSAGVFSLQNNQLFSCGLSFFFRS